MRLVSFNPLRTLGLPNQKYVKPEHMFKEIEAIKEADVVLFPEHWQVNPLIYGLKKTIFPSAATIHLGYSKTEMTRALWTVCPEHVPYTEILANTKENREYVLDVFPLPFIAKDPRNARGNGVFLIENKEQFLAYAANCDVLYVQEYLPCNRDLRVCVVGDEIIGAYWRTGEGSDFRHNVARGGGVVYEWIPDSMLELVLRVARALDINHAGFDLLLYEGKPYILEFNVLFGNQGLQPLGIRVESKIYEYLLKMCRSPFPTSPQPPLLGGKHVS